MAQETRESSEVRETDIVFDCPHCGKSLAIDYRGAGLTIPCTDCGRNVEVPIPEGMQITDIDSSAEEQEVRILNLRRSLQMAELRIDHLETELRDTIGRRDELERGRAENGGRMGQMVEQVTRIEAAVMEIGEAIRLIRETISQSR